MRQRHLETFYTVMICETVTQAARRLGVSQPSVTLTIRQAEKDLGFSLFHRTGGRLTPTAEALTLFKSVERAKESIDGVRMLCTQLRKGEASHLRIAATQTMVDKIVPQAIKMFVRRDTGSAIEILTQRSKQILKSLDNRKPDFDLGLIFGDSQGKNVHSIPIGKCGLYCVVPSSWKIVQSEIGAGGALSSLQSYDMIGVSETEPVGFAARNFLVEAGLDPQINIKTQNHKLAGDLASHGLGFALLDSISAQDVQRRQPDKVDIFPILDADEIAITAVIADTSLLTPPVQRFINCFKAEFEKISLPESQ